MEAYLNFHTLLSNGKAYSNKEYLKAKEIQKEIDFFNYGLKNNNSK